jgi:hypothetical protein
MMTTPATTTAPASPAERPAYELIPTGSDNISFWGQIRVSDPADLAAAMEHWEMRWYGYSPRIYADSVDPCLAHWRRWNTCE